MIIFENIRLTVYSPTLFRLEFQPEQSFVDAPHLLMAEKFPEEIDAKITKKKDTLTVRTEKCRLTYCKKGNRLEQDSLKVEFLWGKEKKIWRLGDEHREKIATVTRSLDVWPQGLPRCPNSIIVNKEGWHCLEDNSGAYWRESWPEIKRFPEYRNLFLFFYGQDIAQAFRDFIYIFGRPPLIPRQVFGAWYSRWHDYKDKELEKLVAEYQKKEFPLDVLVVDVDWHKHHWNGYDWRKESFPQPARFIDKMKKLGLRLVLNDHPGYNANDPLPEDESRLKKLKQEIAEPPYKGQWACDWSRRSIVEKWKKHCLQDLLEQGIDWWWIDGWGDIPFPEVDSQFWLNHNYYQATREHKPQSRALILSRWGGPGSHRYPVQFSGDTHCNFESLKHQVSFTAYSGGLGAYYWSHDIGGFHEAEVDEQLYIRWVQFGALSPMFRTHSNHGIREPMNFSEKAQKIYKRYANLRYSLIPYLEQLHFHNHITGFPLVYPMDFFWPEISDAQKVSEQYYFGKSIITAPITREITSKAGNISKNVWLPPGEWYDVISGRLLDGNCNTNKRVGLEDIPLFIEKGAIIATAPVVSPIPQGAYPEIVVYFFGFKQEGREVLFFDDGDSYHQMEKGRVNKLEIHYQREDNEIILECRSEKGAKWLPQKLTFACFSEEPFTLFQGKKQLTLHKKHHHFLVDFGMKSMHCSSWAVKKQKNYWRLKFE